MTCGIYAIVNTTNDKVYIGQSQDIERRWKQHKCELENKKHKNKYLEKSYYKYGKENFNFIILHECNENDLNYYEMKYILLYESNKPKKGYNKTNGGDCKRCKKISRKKLIDLRKGEKNVFSKKLYVYNIETNKIKIYNCKQYLAQELYEKGYTKTIKTSSNYLNINCKQTKLNTKIPFHEYVIISTQELLNEYLKENNLIKELELNG